MEITKDMIRNILNKICDEKENEETYEYAVNELIEDAGLDTRNHLSIKDALYIKYGNLNSLLFYFIKKAKAGTLSDEDKEGIKAFKELAAYGSNLATFLPKI